MIKIKSNPIVIRDNKFIFFLDCSNDKFQFLEQSKKKINLLDNNINHNKNLILENSIFDLNEPSPPNDFFIKLHNRMKMYE